MHEGGTSCSARAPPIAEPLDHVGPRDGVERERRHVAVRHEIAAQPGIVGAQEVVGPGGGDVAAAVMAGMEQKLRALLDADVPDCEEQRARRLAMPDDPKPLAALLLLPPDRADSRE